MQTLRYNIARGITWFMKKLSSLLILTLIAFQHLEAADEDKIITTNTDFCSLPTELQADTFKHNDFDTKLNIITFNVQLLLCLCLDIKKLDSLLPYITKPQAKLENFYQDINKALGVIEAHTYLSAWENNTIQYQELIRMDTLKTHVINTIQELDAALDRLKELLHQYTDANIYIHTDINTDINIDIIAEVKKRIDIIKQTRPLFPISRINLDRVHLNYPDEWITLIQELPDTVERIHLVHTNINTSGLLKLNRLKHLEEINLFHVPLSNRNDWAQIIQALPDTVQRLHIHWVNINTSGLLQLNRLVHLEEVILACITLSQQEDWVPIIQALPETLKRIELRVTNINALGFMELHHLIHLERIHLWNVTLSNRENWASVIQALPETLTRIELQDTNIDASGLVALSRMKQLEEIKSRGIKLSKQEDWASVIQALPETVRRMDLTWSDCPDECIDILKAKGIVVIL